MKGKNGITVHLQFAEWSIYCRILSQWSKLNNFTILDNLTDNFGTEIPKWSILEPYF